MIPIQGPQWMPAGRQGRFSAARYSSLLKKSLYSGCSKMLRCKAPEVLRSEAYLDVRRNDER